MEPLDDVVDELLELEEDVDVDVDVSDLLLELLEVPPETSCRPLKLTQLTISLSNALEPLTWLTVYVFCLTQFGMVSPVAYVEPVTLTFDPTPMEPPDDALVLDDV